MRQRLKPFKQVIQEKQAYHQGEGESGILHHITSSKFNTFHPLSHFGTANAARSMAANDPSTIQDRYRGWKKHSYNHFAVRLKTGNVANSVDTKGQKQHRPQDLLNITHPTTGKQIFSDKEKQQHTTNLGKMVKKGDAAFGTKHAYSNELPAKNYMAKAIRDKGFHTIKYKNQGEDPGKHSYIITHPSQVRTLQQHSINNQKLNLQKGDRATSPNLRDRTGRIRGLY